jgi:hypothetical protein
VLVVLEVRARQGLLDVMASGLYHLLRYAKVTASPTQSTSRSTGPRKLLVEIKVLATRQRRRFNELVEEAFIDLLTKYRDKGKGEMIEP